MLFWEIVVPELRHVAEDTTQQTPNPAAQPPSDTPDLEVHSVEVTQVPVSPELAVHASFGNCTTENRPMGLGAEELRPTATEDEIKLTKCNIGKREKIPMIEKNFIICVRSMQKMVEH